MKTFNFLITEDIQNGDVVYRHTTLNSIKDPIGEITIAGVNIKNKRASTDKDFWCKLKTTDKHNAKPGDFIIFKNDMSYVSIEDDSKQPKAGDIFEITSIDNDFTIRYGLKKSNSNDEYGVQERDVIIIESIEIPDFDEDLLFNQDTRVLCDTHEKAKNLCIFMQLKGKRWCTGRSYLFITQWHVYKNNTYYCTKEGAFRRASDSSDYIIRYEDAILNKCSTKTQDQIDPIQEKTESDSEIKIKKQGIEMQKLQEIINQNFGTNDYQQKPNYLVVVYTPDGSEYAQGTAETLEQVENTLASDYRLIGHTAVTYKIHKEFTTKVPVVATKLKVIKDAVDEVTE